MTRVLAGLLGRFKALPRSRRWITGGFAAAVLVAVAITTAQAATPSPAAQPAALRVDDRANRGEARSIPSAAGTAAPTSAAPTSAAPTGAAPATTTAPAPTTKATTPKATTTRPKTSAVKPAGCSAYTGVKLTACTLLPSYGFSTGEMAALVPMWQRESGWNYAAYNSGSGATGIPQALPGSKMATAGSDWRTNPATQIKWGLGYIKSTYGSPSNAWAFWQSHGWY